MARQHRLALAALAVAAAACGSPHPRAAPALTCVTNLDLSCQPLYDPPVFPTLFAQILMPTCATGRGTCHTSDAAMGGLVMEDASETYERLLGTFDGRARVKPGDPACSLLVERLEAKSADLRMPPGPTPLDAAARCAIEQWIEQGAAR